MGDLQARLQGALGDTYRIERELGGGGMSRLFLASEASLNRLVVVKVLPPEFTSHVSAGRFQQEIQVAAHLQHPNILPVLSAGAKDDLLYYVMPYVAGESLRQRLTREGKLPIADAVRMLSEVADALAYAHAEGVIHRDIKPENILLEGNHAVLTDFGVARALVEARSGERLTATGMGVGTPGYVSPEQAAGERHIDARSDVYALAVVGYEMLAGAPPFAGPTAQAVLAAHLTTPPKPLTEVRSEVPADLSAAIATALAKAPEARFPSAAEFREALNAAIARPAGQARRIRVRLATGAVFAAAVVVALVLALRPKPTGPLDPNLVAVAPFDVLDAKLALWHEGLVDVLSRNLDGAGPIRTVSPSVVVHRWRGRADPASAVDLGRRTGAQWVVFGQLLSTRADSVRVAAALLDARSRRTVAEIELRDVNENLDRMADSLTVALLRELGQTRPIGAVRRTPFGVTSLPALKAFLQGEQYFRRTDWDSAITAYQRAIALDSAFAPALRHLSSSLGWKPGGALDSLAHAYAFRAGAFNHGLGPRDSMLVLADSLLAALFERPNDPAWWARNRRLFATLDAAARRYPDDPEVWFELGDARFHFGYWRGVTQAQVFAAFNRSIALDSAFAPAYFHCVALAANLGDRAAGRRYAAAYLARAAKDAYSDGVALAAQLLAPVRTTMLDTLPADVLYYAGYLLRRWPDSAETTVRLTRLILDGRHGSLPFLTDSATKLRLWAMTLASRGHLHEAYGVVGSRVPTLFSELAAFGGLPRDSASAQFGRWLRQGTAEAASAGLPWWTANGDTVSLLRFIRRSAAQVRTRPPSEGAGATLWLYAAARARAYLALARHDTSEALRSFALLPDSQCGDCLSDWDVLVRAQLLSARGEESDALRLVEPERAEARTLPVSVVTVLERGRVAERLGDRETALTAYRFVADVWRNADAELRPYVAEAAAALKRLGGEPRP